MGLCLKVSMSLLSLSLGHFYKFYNLTLKLSTQIEHNDYWLLTSESASISFLQNESNCSWWSVKTFKEMFFIVYGNFSYNTFI